MHVYCAESKNLVKQLRKRHHEIRKSLARFRRAFKAFEKKNEKPGIIPTMSGCWRELRVPIGDISKMRSGLRKTQKRRKRV
jgi:hypothetical protein